MRFYNAGIPSEINGTDDSSIDFNVSSVIPNQVYYSSLHPLAIAGIASGGTFVAIILIVLTIFACRKLKSRTKVSKIRISGKLFLTEPVRNIVKKDIKTGMKIGMIFMLCWNLDIY